MEDNGDREIGKGVGIKEDTDGLENVGIVVDAVENLCEPDEVAVLAGVEVPFALKQEIDAC